jgi:hypothetical protein
MFGFYSFSEKPFSAAAVATAGATHEGQANLQASGTISANESLVLSGAGSLSSAATITAATTVIAKGASLLVDSATVSANGTLIISHSSTISSSGTVDGTSSVIIPGEFNVSGSGTVTSEASVVKSIKSSIEASGSLSSDIHTVVGIAGSLSGVATISSEGTAFKTISASITGSGVITNTPTNLLVGKADLTSPGVTLIAGTFGPGQLKASLSASATVTSQIGLDLDSQATIGTTFAEFIKGTKRLSYVPAMPLLSHKDRDIVLDLPFYEGAGPYIHNVASRSQKAALNGLEPMWQREDGFRSLYSPGTTFNDYRITTDTTGITFDRAGIVLRFKPTRNTTAREFLFTIRGTANNNNEIDCYTRTANGKVYLKVYNGTSEQALQIPNLVVNQWNTLVITWGSGNLKGSLNGNEFSTYSSATVPHATLVGKTLYLYGTSSDTLTSQGYIGAFRWYNRELSIVEAKGLHKNINKDYTFNSLIPNHYRMSEVSGTGRILKNGSADIIGNGTIAAHGSFILANLKSSFGGLAEIAANGSSTPLDVSSASLSATATFLANGILLGELDIVPFTVFINRLENYDQNVYQTFVKEMNVARSKVITASIDQQKTNTINIDKILEKTLEK